MIRRVAGVSNVDHGSPAGVALLYVIERVEVVTKFEVGAAADAWMVGLLPQAKLQKNVGNAVNLRQS